MVFAVTQESFAGPLALLLELIEGKELAITKVSLARVADEFLLHIQEHDLPSDELADFLLVASRLIYLKSRELMPYLRIVDEDVGSDALEEQLRIYREFVDAAERLEEQFLTSVLHTRPYVKPVIEMPTGMVPPVGLTAEALASGYRDVL